MSKSFSFDGTDMATYDLQVVEFNVPEMPLIDFKVHSAVYGDSAFTSINHTTRAISLQCAVCGDSQSDLNSNMDSIKALLNPILTDKVLTIDDIPDRRFLGRITGISAPTIKGRWVKVFTIQFQCLAHMQAVDETESSGAISGDPYTVTIASVGGTVSRTPASLYVRNSTGAAITSGTISVANDTTNETITWKGTLPDGYWLRFGLLDADGTFKADIKMSTASGADPTVLSYTNSEIGYQSGDWPRLKGGVDNDITVTGVSTGTLWWTYRARYL